MYESKKQDELIRQKEKLIYEDKLERKKREEEKLQAKNDEEKDLRDSELLTEGEQCEPPLDPLKTRVTFIVEPQKYISTDHTPAKALISDKKPRIPSTPTHIRRFLSYIVPPNSRSISK